MNRVLNRLVAWKCLIILSLMFQPFSLRLLQANDPPPSQVVTQAVKIKISEIVQKGIDSGQMPGCVVCFGNSEQILFLESFGLRAAEPMAEPMTSDTIFDVASLTKPIVTATAIVKLMEEGKLTLDDSISSHLAPFGQNGKDQVTVLDCLVHRSGLIPDNAISDYQNGIAFAWEKIYSLRLQSPRGTQFKYSDVNFLVLGKLVEELTGKTLDGYVSEKIFEPSGMGDSSFHVHQSNVARVAPTEKRDGEWIRGTVHDPRAHLLGGVAGHAGLFSTAQDMAKFSMMILNQGISIGSEGTKSQVLKAESIDALFRHHDVNGDIRGLGWDIQSRYSSNKGKKLSMDSIGHGGFTGTVLWIDRSRDMFFCFLSNRLHPDGKGNVNPIAGEIWDAICE